MKGFIKKASAVAISLSLLASTAAPALAANIVIRNNGRNSTNTVRVRKSSIKRIRQSNSFRSHTSIGINVNTGDNENNNNTGGDNDITTGDVGIMIRIRTFGNINIASIGCCDTCGEEPCDGDGEGDGVGPIGI